MQDHNVLYQFCAFRVDRKKKQNDHPDIRLAESFSTSPLKTQNGIQRNLTGSKISTSDTKFFFRVDLKTIWPPWSVIDKDMFDFFSYTAKWNSIKLC